MRYIDVHELNLILNKTPKAHIIDVRSIDEHRSGHVPQAKCIPLDLIMNNPKRTIEEIKQLIDEKETIYLICLSDRRSFMACHKLMEHGINNVCYIKGGTKAWIASGYPLVFPD